MKLCHHYFIKWLLDTIKLRMIVWIWRKIIHEASWWLTHWGRVMHTCVCKLAIIGSYYGLSPGRRQCIMWTNAGILLIWTNLNEILSEIRTFSFKKIHLSRPQCINNKNAASSVNLCNICLTDLKISFFYSTLSLPSGPRAKFAPDGLFYVWYDTWIYLCWLQ